MKMASVAWISNLTASTKRISWGISKLLYELVGQYMDRLDLFSLCQFIQNPVDYPFYI